MISGPGDERSSPANTLTADNKNKAINTVKITVLFFDIFSSLRFENFLNCTP